MATVADLKGAITLDYFQQPVILEPCGHSGFDKDDIVRNIWANLKTQILEWKFSTITEYKCPQCRNMCQLNEIVLNDEWERVNKLIQTYKSAMNLDSKDLEKKLLSEVFIWNWGKKKEELNSAWKKQKDIGTATIVEVLELYKDPELLRLIAIYKRENQGSPQDFQALQNFADTYLTQDVEIFKDIRPLHLIEGSEEAKKERKEAFQSEAWSPVESLLFIASCIYHITYALIAEITLGFMYFGGSGLLTKKQYDDLRTSHFAESLVPLFLQYMGFPTEKPAAD